MFFFLFVWLIRFGRELFRVVLEGFFSLGIGRFVDLLLMLEFMLLVLDLFLVLFRLVDLLGFGKFRYCKFVRELRDRYLSFWFWVVFMFVFRLVDRSISVDDFGILFSVVDLLVTVVSLVVIMVRSAVELFCFLNLKLLVLVAGVLELLARGFLDSLLLLRFAFDGERFIWEVLGDSLFFLDIFVSFVFFKRN